MLGPGRYDQECADVREKTGGGVVLIVLGGNKGEGFSAQIRYEDLLALPSILRTVADQLEHDRTHAVEKQC